VRRGKVREEKRAKTSNKQRRTKGEEQQARAGNSKEKNKDVRKREGKRSG
jgi:hypothetical protein